MNKTIALDLDGVIADIGKSIDDALELRGLIDYDYTNWLVTHHECDLSNEIMSDPLFWKNMHPLADAWHQVNYWFSQGYDVHIVTARRTDTSINLTQPWLDEWKINTMIPHFCKMGEKHNVIHDLNPLFMVEDNPNEVMTLLDEGVNAFLRKAWYNQAYWDKLPTIGTLFELSVND